MTYYQITSEERYTIAALRREGFCSAEIARRRNASKSSDRHRVTRLTTDFETPVPLSTSANVASMSRLDIPWTYIRAISSSSFSVRLT